MIHIVAGTAVNMAHDIHYMVVTDIKDIQAVDQQYIPIGLIDINKRINYSNRFVVIISHGNDFISNFGAFFTNFAFLNID